jgi:azurin
MIRKTLILPVHAVLGLGLIVALTAGLVACSGDGGTPRSSIVITGDDMMRFSPTEFTVAAGSTVTVTLQNIGRMPKEAMGHNLVILTMGTDPIAFAEAAVRHPANEYIAPEMSDRVIAATAVLGPGEEQVITFTAPSEPGDYPFVCSFPGHTQAGMRGIMRVR